MFSTETVPFIPLSLDALPYQNLRPILRIDAPTNACQSVVTARVIAVLIQHRKHTSTHVYSRTVGYQTVRDRFFYDNVAVTPNRYLYTRVESILRQKRDAIIRRRESQYEDIALRADHSSWVSFRYLFGITARVMLLSEHAGESHWLRARSRSELCRATFRRFPSDKKRRTDRQTDRRTDGREERKEARGMIRGRRRRGRRRSWLAGWLAGPPAGSGRALV